LDKEFYSNFDGNYPAKNSRYGVCELKIMLLKTLIKKGAICAIFLGGVIGILSQ
jgi:hypothetical protein